MMITIHDLKEAMYIVQTVLGFLCLGLALFLLQSGGSLIDSICSIMSGLILMVVGIFAIFFGLETYLLRDDPDIWR
jgi:hypothetical protein